MKGGHYFELEQEALCGLTTLWLGPSERRRRSDYSALEAHSILLEKDSEIKRPPFKMKELDWP